MDTENENKHASFVQSLRGFAEKYAAVNPALADLRLLNQKLIAEARQQLAGERQVQPFGGVVDENGAITVLDSEDTVEVVIEKLRALAKEVKIRAASACAVVQRPLPAGGTPVDFVQFHFEHGTGLAMLIGVPADESLEMQGLAGVHGPAVLRYGKKVPPVIFVD